MIWHHSYGVFATSLMSIFSSSASFGVYRTDVLSRSVSISAKPSNQDDDVSWLRSRRSLIQSLGFIPLLEAQLSSANAINNGNLVSPESSGLENGLLEIRVLENLLSPPPYGMEVGDIFYPR